MWVGGRRHASAALPPGKTRYPLYRRLGGPQGRSERVRKISPPPVFDPQTVQPKASRYTDWAIPVLKDVQVLAKYVAGSASESARSFGVKNKPFLAEEPRIRRRPSRGLAIVLST